MAKFTIVFHSVCGNTYQIADCFYRALQERGQEVTLYRTADASFESGEKRSDEFKHLQAAIESVPVIGEAAQVLGSDVLLLGSPTYYGCVSAQMKAFMDSFEKIWADAPTAGMYFGCFTSAGDGCGGPGGDGRDPNGGKELCGPYSESYFIREEGGEKRETGKEPATDEEKIHNFQEKMFFFMISQRKD